MKCSWDLKELCSLDGRQCDVDSLMRLTMKFNILEVLFLSNYFGHSSQLIVNIDSYQLIDFCLIQLLHTFFLLYVLSKLLFKFWFNLKLIIRFPCIFRKVSVIQLIRMHMMAIVYVNGIWPLENTERYNFLYKIKKKIFLNIF